MRVAARAKVNLRLRVLAREATGYHQIETILCRVALADEIVIERAQGSDLQLEVHGADIGPAADNLVARAVRAYSVAAGIEPAFSVALHKRVPAGAGLGGGSSDAAATLHALDAMHEERLGARRLLQLGAGLGSDIPFFLADAPCALAWGRGQRLLTHRGPGAAPALIAMPPAHVATADAYARLRIAPHGAGAAAIGADALGSWKQLAALAGNDFEPVVVPSVSGLADALELIRRAGAIVAQLTGSGAAIFGVFDSDTARDETRRALERLQPDLQTFATVAGI